MNNLELDRRSKYTLQAIRTALFTLLNEKELKKITVTDVCREADINRGTFYKYFEDVPDLFAKIEASLVDEICEIIRKDCLDNFSIENILSNVVDIIVENRDFTRLFVKAPDNTQCLQQIMQTFRPQLIEKTISNIPNLTKELSDICFDFLLGGIVNLLVQWVKNDMDIPIEQMKELLIRLTNSTFQAL